MALRMREFAGSPDLIRMCELAHTAGTVSLHVMDLPYRLSSWALDDPENVGLWVDASGRLIAWAVMQAPMWSVDYAYWSDGDTSQVHAAILNWADGRANVCGRPAWFVNVSEDQRGMRRDLEAAGFACQASVPQNPWSKVFLRRACGAPLSNSTVPAGFTVRPLAGQEEVDSYVALHRAAFDSTSMTPAWRSRVLQCPQYRADLDMVAVTPNGGLAAFCIAWFDAKGWTGRPCGQIEPMGVHADFRGRGIGRAILLEALGRLYSAGALEVYVEADESEVGALPFYRSAGFEIAQRILIYRRNYIGA